MKRLAETLGQRLTALSGTQASLRIRACAKRDEAATRAELPRHGAAFIVQLTGSEKPGPLLFLLAHRAALCVATARTESDEAAVQARITADDGLNETERKALQELTRGLGEDLMQAVQDAGGKVEGQVELAFLTNSVWSTDGDPLPEGDALGAALELTFGKTKGLESSLLLAADLAAKALPAIEVDAAYSQAPTGGVGTGLRVLGVGTSPFLDDLRNKLGPESTLTPCSGIAELIAQFADSDGAVVEIVAGHEDQLALLFGIRALPDARELPLVVVLEHSTVINVLRCGRLGLHRVLPAEFAAEDLSRRLQAH